MLVIQTSNDEIVIAHRGTATTEDWQTNIALRLVDWSGIAGGQIQEGYSWEMTEIEKMLQPSQSSLIATGFPIHFTGHSQGGALATIHALSWFQQQHSKIASVCTFGSPKAGDFEFAATYDQALASVTKRYQNYADIVTYLPPTIGEDDYEILEKLQDKEIWFDQIKLFLDSDLAKLFGNIVIPEEYEDMVAEVVAWLKPTLSALAQLREMDRFKHVSQRVMIGTNYQIELPQDWNKGALASIAWGFLMWLVQYGSSADGWTEKIAQWIEDIHGLTPGMGYVASASDATWARSSSIQV